MDGNVGDYQLWIDSDIVFDTNKFWQLCDMALNEEEEEKDVAGWYATRWSHNFVAHWLEEDDRKNGGVMNQKPSNLFQAPQTIHRINRFRLGID